MKFLQLQRRRVRGPDIHHMEIVTAGLTWSDGSPVTSADLVFTAQYCMDPEGGCAQLAKFDGVDSVEAIDESDS